MQDETTHPGCDAGTDPEPGPDQTAAAPGEAGGGRWEGGDRGDVPGWVLITLMTAGLVVALWAVAGPTLANLFESSIASVTGPP